jgi:energy-coupling factor transporter ATP-binding protein EcfA2
VIRFDGFSFWYPETAAETLRSVRVQIAEGELALVVGRTGSGKSTLLKSVNGLVPQFTG